MEMDVLSIFCQWGGYVPLFFPSGKILGKGNWSPKMEFAGMGLHLLLEVGRGSSQLQSFDGQQALASSPGLTRTASPLSGSTPRCFCLQGPQLRVTSL